MRTMIRIYHEMKLGIITAAICSATGLFAETLQINGAFNGSTVPDGWNVNKPKLWDSEGALTIQKIDEIEKNTILMTSRTKQMQLYTAKAFPVQKGDTVIVKGIVKGDGNGVFGIYNYPAGWASRNEFKGSGEWKEVVAKFAITTSKTKEVRIMVGVLPKSSIFFMDLTAEIEHLDTGKRNQD